MSSSGSWEGGWTKGLENLVDAGQDGNSPEEQLWRKEASALLTEALEALPTQQKEAILLHYFYAFYWAQSYVRFSVPFRLVLPDSYPP